MESKEKEQPGLPRYSLSHYFPPAVRHIVPVILLATMGVLVYSNLHKAEYVQVQIRPTYKTYEALSMLNNIDHNNSTEVMNYIETRIHKMSAYMKYINPRIKKNVSYSFEYKMDVFEITIVDSIQDFWDSQAYELAIIIAAGSLIWPYIKILLLMVVWLKPMHQNTRTKLTLFLDQMGKWSYLDIYASVIITVTFYVQTSFHFQDLYLDVKIVPEMSTGIVTFAIVNIISMAYSTAFIFFDQHYGYPHHVENYMTSQYIIYNEKRKNKIKNINTTPDLSAIRESPCSPILYAPAPITNPNIDIANDDDDDEFWKSDIGLPMHSDIEPPKYKITGVYKYYIRAHIHLWRKNQQMQVFAGLYKPQSYFGVICFSLFLCGLVFCLWLIIDTIYTCPARFDINGIIGLLVSDNVRCYNPIETANILVTSTDTYNFAMFLSTIYYITIIVFPIVTQCVLILLWLFPMKHKVFVFFLKSLWFVQAWNALDVFCVGTVAGALQIDLISSWIIDTQIPQLCGDNGVFNSCFIVEGTVTRGAWMAGGAALYQWISIYFTLNLAKDIGVHGIEY